MNRATQVLTIFWCVVIVEIFAIINSYVVNLKGASVDAERFIEQATIWTQVGELRFVTNAEFFIQLLGIIFTVTGSSEFVGLQLGVIAMIFAAFYFMWTCEELDISAPSWAIALLFLWPSALPRISTTLREPYLIFFTIAICYYVVAYKNHKRGSDIGKFFAVCAVAFLFHKAFAVFFVFGAAYMLFWILKVEGSWFKSRVVLLRIILVALTIGALAYIMMFQSDVRGLKPLIALLTADAEYIDQVVSYKSSREFRTTYDARLDLSSPLAFILSVPQIFAYYMFGPFPWQISAPVDLLPAFEGWVRAGAIYLFVRHWVVRKEGHPALVPLMILVLVLCLIWSAGTSNYGTASRHHLTTNWAFVLVYVAWFLRSRTTVRTVDQLPLTMRPTS